jgi:predicted GNAT family N-acyltransferase
MRTAVVPLEEIFELRRDVLRPGRPRETAAFIEDGHPAVFHIAAYEPDGTLAACATFFPEQLPGEPAHAYRLRGMASAPAVRGQGYGAGVLRAGMDEARARGAELVWCNGRSAARGFYERQGFAAVGEEFQLEPAGPHHVFVAKLS